MTLAQFTRNLAAGKNMPSSSHQPNEMHYAERIVIGLTKAKIQAPNRTHLLDSAEVNP
jgi:hypothetical protein